VRAGRGVGAAGAGTGPGREEDIMTRAQLNSRIAARTGESLAVIRHLGFQLEPQHDEEPVTDDLRLVVHCPFCRRQVPYPGRSGDGANALAECVACDVYFEFEDRDVFPASVGTAGSGSQTRRRQVHA
jgi:hypothetical protein